MKMGKAPKKAENFDKVTAENFDAFEMAALEWERRYRKERAVWGLLKPASDLFFLIHMLAATYMFVKANELPVLSALGPVVDLLGGAGEKDGGLVSILGDILAITLITFVLHAVLAAVLKLIWPSKRSAPPTQGSTLERVEALEERFKAKCKSFPWCWTALGVLAYPAMVLLPMVLDGAWNQAELAQHGVLYHVADMAIMLVLAVVAYAGPYLVYTLGCVLCYRTSGGAVDLTSKLWSCKFDLQREQDHQERLKKEEQDRLRGDELYRQATAGGAMNEELIAQAAELGCRPACLYMGRRLLEAWYEGQYTTSYTKAELEEMAELAMDYFTIAREEKMLPVSAAEAELGYLVFWEAAERLNMSMYDWKDALEKLRRLKASGMLPKRYDDIYDFAVEKAVDRIDMIAEHERWKDVTVSDVGSGTSSDSWDVLNDDLDAVQRSLGGPGWSDGV